MLDQNTDRMWYVIGAIVIGAAIIAMGLNIFDESFKSVENNYAELTALTEGNISSSFLDFESRLPGALRIDRDESGVRFENTDSIDMFVDYESNGTIDDGNYYRGLRIDRNMMRYSDNTSYKILFDYVVLDGDLLSFGGHMPSNYELVSLTLDGVVVESSLLDFESLYPGTNDRLNHRVELVFNTGDRPPYSSNQILDYNRDIWFQPNRGSWEDVTVRFENIVIREHN